MTSGRDNRIVGLSQCYALALFDAIRVTLHAIGACFSGWLAFNLYYAPDSFMPIGNLLLFFVPPSSQYAQLSLLGGIIFSAVGFMKHGRTSIDAHDGQLSRLVSSWSIALLIVISILFLLKTGSEFSRGWMIIWSMTTPVCLLICQKIEHRIIAMLRRFGFSRRRVAIVGATLQATQLLDHFGRDQDSQNFDVVGIFSDRVRQEPSDRETATSHRSVDDLIERCRREPIDAVVIAQPGSATLRIIDAIEKLKEVPADIYLGPDLAQFDLQLGPSSYLGSIPVTSLTRLPMRDWAGIAKRAEDKIIVLIAGLLLAPLLLLTAVLIKLDSPGPVLFRQRRFGFNNLAFDVYKFRTMADDQCDPTGAVQTTRDDLRITRVGRILRRTSIDELPQLINVWLGDMSIVGPRAHPVGMMVADQPYHELIRHYAARHRVRPGITGLAQVNGNRGEVNSPKKAEHRVYHDLFYIENWSIWLDLSIILRTIVKLPFDRSAY